MIKALPGKFIGTISWVEKNMDGEEKNKNTFRVAKCNLSILQLLDVQN